eukprot:m.181562 g.181562  ORF g.181562 m.181562 type:complete len:474 (+) comp16872_c0_seq12:173-1594(+)
MKVAVVALVSFALIAIAEKASQPLPIFPSSQSPTRVEYVKNTTPQSNPPRAPGMWDEPAPVPAPKRSYKIGICFSIPPRKVSMYTNGAKQASFFLQELLEYQNRHDVYFINLDKGDPKNATPEWQLDKVKVIRHDEAVKLKLDVVLELGMQMRQDQVDDLKRSGAKVGAYRSGYNYIMNVETILYDKNTTTMFETKHYDQAWTLPSFNRSNAWLSTIYHSPVTTAPYLWSPRFFDYVVKDLKKRHYYSSRTEKNIAVFEPNLNVVKTSVLPMTIIELLYRESPDLFSKAYITNAENNFNRPYFKQFVDTTMTIFRAKKMFFEARYRFAWVLSEHTDVVLAHQWNCELNYVYIEALYSGYPLVHNSPYFKDCGYYYPANDAYAGKEALKRALLEHDNNLEEYNRKARECVWRHSPYNEANILEWDRLFDEVYERPWSEAEQARLGLNEEVVDTTEEEVAQLQPAANAQVDALLP